MRIKMLGELMLSLLKELERVAESVFEVLLGSGDTRKCFPTECRSAATTLKRKTCLQICIALEEGTSSSGAPARTRNRIRYRRLKARGGKENGDEKTDKRTARGDLESREGGRVGGGEREWMR